MTIATYKTYATVVISFAFSSQLIDEFLTMFEEIISFFYLFSIHIYDINDDKEMFIRPHMLATIIASEVIDKCNMHLTASTIFSGVVAPPGKHFPNWTKVSLRMTYD